MKFIVESKFRISDETSQKITLMSFFCACLVVSIHLQHPTVGVSGWLDQMLAGGISAIAVPVFFCISGYLLCGGIVRKGYHVEVEKRIYSLAVPFFIWGTVSLLSTFPIDVLHDFRCHVPIGTTFFENRHWSAVLINWLGLDFTRMPLCGPLWYLRNLFIFVLISPLILKAVRSWGWIWIGGVFVLFCVWNGFEPRMNAKFNGVLRYGFSLSGLFAFSLGMFLRECNLHLAHRVYGTAAIVTGISLWLITHLTSLSIAWIHPVSMLSMGYAVWTFLPGCHLPKWLVSSSFPIYLMHPIFLGYLQTFPSVVPGTSSIIGFFIHWLGPIALAIGCSCFLHRFFPKLSGVLFGAR